MKSISRSRAICFFLAASGLVLGAAAQSQCFHLDGTQVTDPGVVPCLRSSTNSNANGNNGAPAASMCCNLGRQTATSRIKGRQAPSSDDNSITENASAGQQQQLFFTGPDICLDNGLCQLQLADAQTGRIATPVQFSRDSCTRPDWAGGCLANVCSSVTGGDAAMTPCGGSPTSSPANTTQWCCGSAGSSTTASCCAAWPNHPDAVLVPAVFGSSSSSSSSPPVGGSVDPPRVGPSGSGLPTTVSVSVGPGGVVSLVTVTLSTGFGGTASPFPASRSFVGSRPVTNSAPASTQAIASTESTAMAAVTALGAVATGSDNGRNGSDNSANSDNGETTLVTGATGLNTQEVAGIVAGLVVVVVVLVSVACFTAESMYKKRQQRFRARRLDEAMKQSTFPVAKSRPLM